VPTLVAQRAHVPRTTGATGTAGEQDMTCGVAVELQKQRPAGWNLRIIDADVADALYIGDAFVAIHGDGSTNKAVAGASVGYRTDGASLGAAWKAAYTAHGWPGAWHKDNYTPALSGYYGTGRATEVGNKRAIVIEVGTMTNAADRKWIDANHAAIAGSIWAAVTGGDEDVELDYLHISITDLGDTSHRAALKAAAGKAFAYKEGANTFYVDAAMGAKADTFIDYAKAHGLDCESVSTFAGQYKTMVLRLKGIPAPLDAECAAQLALAKDRLARIHVIAS
jgi:hypothetical protein